MYILTDKQFERLVEEIKHEAYTEGFTKGHKKGYENGLREGMTTDKKGIHMTSAGIFAFDDANFKQAIPVESLGGCKFVT